MNKKTKIALLIGAVAAVISAVVLIVVFWDKLLSLCPCKKKEEEEAFDFTPEEEAPVAEEAPAEEAPVEEVVCEDAAPVYSEEECKDFADLEPAAE